MNRRHLVFNGTVSVIVVTQKYTLIPARVRSNASWIILYQLNPMDFETAYRDAVTLPPYRWYDIIQYVFGVNLRGRPEKIKEEKSEPIEQEEEQPV